MAKSVYIKNCKTCNKEFSATNKKVNYCSEVCKYNKKSINNKIKFKCDYCGKDSEKQPSKYKMSENHFCTYECWLKFRKEKEGSHVECDYCKEQIYKTNAKLETENRFFCNKSCASKWKSENLLGENNKNYKRVIVKCDFCGKDKAIMKSDLQKYKTHFCNTECMGGYRRSEDKSDDEIYNMRKTQEHKDWTNSVYKKDNYTCVISGQVGNSLNAHHLNGYHWDKDNRFNVNNGVTLSEEIHKEFHSIYGVKNNTIEQFCNFYKNKTGNDFEIKDLSLCNNHIEGS